MSFHDLARTLQDLEEIRATSQLLAERLETAQRELAKLGAPAEDVALDPAYAGLSAVADTTALLAAGANAAEFRLRVTLHVPSLPGWRHLRPLAEAFAAHPDWDGELTAPRDLIADLDTGLLPVLALEDWLTGNRLTDVSVTLKRYRGVSEERIREASWATVLLAAYELPEQIDDYWHVVGDVPLPYPVPEFSSDFTARLAALPAGTTTLLWCPDSYEGFLGDGPDSARTIELARRHDVVLLWARDAQEGSQRREQAYVADIRAALVAEGTAIEVSPRDLFHAIDVADGVCGGSAHLAEGFERMGRPVLVEPTDTALEGLRQAASARRGTDVPQVGLIADELRDAFVRDFLGG